MILALNNTFWFDSQALGFGSLMAFGAFDGGAPPPPTTPAVEDHIRVGTIVGALMPEPHVGGF